MKLYLAGPMRGYPQLNHPAFDQAALSLRKAGHEVFSPAENDRAQGITSGTADTVIRVLLGQDLAYITGIADGIVVLPNWQHSRGARAETATAWAIGIPVWEIGPFLAQGSDAGQVTAWR